MNSNIFGKKRPYNTLVFCPKISLDRGANIVPPKGPSINIFFET